MEKLIGTMLQKVVNTIRKLWKEKVLVLLIKGKELFLKGIKFILKLLYRIVRTVDLLAVVILPFCHNSVNYVVAQWIWYPASIVFLLCTIIEYTKKKKPVFENPVFEFLSKMAEATILPLMLCIFGINYYENDKIWLQIIFVILFIVIPFFFFSIYDFVVKQNQFCEEEKKRRALITCKQILLYWLFDFFYLSIINNWHTFTYITGIVAIVVIFLNLVKTFFSEVKSIMSFLPFDLILGMGLSIYLIYIVPDDSLREIIIAIVASVYGGLLALTGVAWTIRHENIVRQDELQRIETERREEERKKYIPYIRISFAKEQTSLIANANVVKILNLSESKNILEGNTFYCINIKTFKIKNISSSNIILSGVIISGKYFGFSRKEIVEPNAECQVATTNNWIVEVVFLDEYISLIIDDVLGYQYEVKCLVEYESKDGFSTTVLETGEEFIGYHYTYRITAVELPVLVERKEERE